MNKIPWKDKKNKGKTCIYCTEEREHPAFSKEMLCLSCASDLMEDFRERLEKFELENKQNHLK